MKKPMSPRAVVILFLLFAIVTLSCFVVFKYNVDRSRHLKANVYSDVDEVTTQVGTTEEGNLTMALFQRKDNVRCNYIVMYTKSGLVVNKIVYGKDGHTITETTRIDAE